MTLKSGDDPSRITKWEAELLRDHDGWSIEYDPRPEFDIPQNNPTNEFLNGIREDITLWKTPELAYIWWAEDYEMNPPVIGYGAAKDLHAYNVIRRLANLARERHK